jgi:hypothetical protein
MGIIGFGLWLNCPQCVDPFEIENPGLKHDFRQNFSFKKGDSRKISRSLRETPLSSTLYNVLKIVAPSSKLFLLQKGPETLIIQWSLISTRTEEFPILRTVWKA